MRRCRHLRMQISPSVPVDSDLPQQFWSVCQQRLYGEGVPREQRGVHDCRLLRQSPEPEPFITLIHKFREEDLSGLKFTKDSEEVISNRRNVIAIMDEGHRTQYGKLAEQMRTILKKAFFFAFTGTPIAKKGRDTYLTFSYPEQGELYIHKYFIEDSIRDGFTLPIVFQTRMEKKVGLDKKRLQGFLGVKEAGLIIDYVGVLGEFEKALAIYQKQDVKYVAIKLDEEVKKFTTLLQETEEIFDGIDLGRTHRETLKSAVKLLFHDHDAENKFLVNYKRLIRFYEFLGPRHVPEASIARLKWLAAIYQFYLRWTGTREEEPEVEEYFRKYFSRTLGDIHKTLEIKLKEEFPILKLDVNYLNNLKKAHASLEDKVYDMVFALNKYILVDRSQKMVYEPIARKVELIVRKWKDRKIDVKEAYERLSEAVRDIQSLEKRQRELGFSEGEYFLLTALEEKLGRSEELVKEVRALWKDWERSGKLFGGWNRKQTALKEVGRELRKFLRKKMPLAERNEVYGKIIKGLREI
ncbi:MAG: DEAD/DEAH box helicase family protein [Candidatus Hadarchaeum sp.]|uniref:DEAD/DEAH box helicase family protein n=1 Tax=Candidatus Hadarchaeum sp. TaxID=2883567 RepID=UPI003D0BE204